MYLAYARGTARASVHSASASADWAAFADVFAGAESFAIADSVALAESFAVAEWFAFADWLARLFAACAEDWAPAGVHAALRKAIWFDRGKFRVWVLVQRVRRVEPNRRSQQGDTGLGVRIWR